MRKIMKINNEILKQMKKIYYVKGKDYLDWMGFKITNENKPSYHHIVKAYDLRENDQSDVATLENGAYLGKKSHELLHKIEYLDNDLYIAWNKLFLLINKNKEYPKEDIWQYVFKLKEESLNTLEKDNQKKLN